MLLVKYFPRESVNFLLPLICILSIRKVDGLTPMTVTIMDEVVLGLAKGEPLVVGREGTRDG